MKPVDTKEKGVIERSRRPSAEFRYFTFDPNGAEFIYYRSADERDADSQNIIAHYLDDGWDEEVEQIIAGEISHTCEQTDARHRPDDEDLDDEDCDGEGTYWGEFDTICNYELAPVTANGGK
ncbi:hypothetical protein ACDX36_26170 [Pseudomonas aeruginosa]|jgi:hypothetical protein|uniref:hypothetical protein n=1 Tax=Pseudomonas aeruginosa TaxID=287 RepID=UPI0039C002D5